MDDETSAFLAGLFGTRDDETQPSTKPSTNHGDKSEFAEYVRQLFKTNEEN